MILILNISQRRAGAGLIRDVNVENAAWIEFILSHIWRCLPRDNGRGSGGDRAMTIPLPRGTRVWAGSNLKRIGTRRT
jgi:hypothetical protein